MERTIVDVAGWPTPVQVAGSGPPLLYLHGEGDTSAWAEVHEALAATFTVYAPVAPGFGGTELPDWLDGVEDLSFHHVDLLAALGVRAPLVVGVSLGGWMALDLAVRRADLLAGVVLVGALGLRPVGPDARPLHAGRARGAGLPLGRPRRRRRRPHHRLHRGGDGAVGRAGGTGPADVGTALRPSPGPAAAPRELSRAGGVGWC
ncbi:MAG: alpha/beta fold hydrolase [Acidimicrobiia bacterium]|nr:alpha/beta fold hydrolase [Acidimicrobiia bacterium]